MKRIISIVIILAMCASLSACGERKVIKGVEYDTYGLLNQEEKRNPDIFYEPIWGNIILGIIFFETIIAPIYVFGFDMFQPVGKRTGIKGQVVGAK